MVDFVKWAVDELREYDLVSANLDAKREEIKRLESQMHAPKAAAFGSIPVQGGGSTYEERLVSDIFRVGAMREALEQAEWSCADVERALNQLEPEEVLVLKELCIRGVSAAAFAEAHCYSIPWVYKLKDKAIKRYTKARFLREKT